MILFLSIVGALIGLYALAVILKFSAAIISSHFSGLKRLDKRIFEELQKNLSTPAQKIMDEQLEKPLHGRRNYFDKSYHLELYINTYDEKRPMKSAFPMRDGSDLASGILEYEKKRYKFTISTQAGAIAGIKIKPSTKKIINKKEITFTKFSVLNDPMVESSVDVVQPEFYKDNEPLPEILNSLREQYKIKKIRKPISEKQRDPLLKKYKTSFPTDYLQLIEVTDGFEIGDDFTIKGLSGIESVFYNAEYWKLIETQSGIVCIKQSKRSSKLVCFYFDEDDRIDDLGDSFMKALETVTRDHDRTIRLL